ncbi:MAG: hypothetical protein R3349_11900 [Geminicoccaceae bacterium]|nr:hypothetical protein [Geminicoccaceae bacterium]
MHESLQALGGLSSPAGSCAWHVVGLQWSVREWAMRQEWGGRPVRQQQAQGILVAALGVLAAHSGYGAAKHASWQMLSCMMAPGSKNSVRRWPPPPPF